MDIASRMLHLRCLFVAIRHGQKLWAMRPDNLHPPESVPISAAYKENLIAMQLFDACALARTGILDALARCCVRFTQIVDGYSRAAQVSHHHRPAGKSFFVFVSERTNKRYHHHHGIPPPVFLGQGLIPESTRGLFRGTMMATFAPQEKPLTKLYTDSSI